MATPNQDVLGKLNSFLRGEISAVETYKQAIEKIKDPAVRSQLQTSAQDHEQRSELLRERISSLGGKVIPVGLVAASPNHDIYA